MCLSTKRKRSYLAKHLPWKRCRPFSLRFHTDLSFSTSPRLRTFSPLRAQVRSLTPTRRAQTHTSRALTPRCNWGTRNARTRYSSARYCSSLSRNHSSATPPVSAGCKARFRSRARMVLPRRLVARCPGPEFGWWARMVVREG